MEAVLTFFYILILRFGKNPALEEETVAGSQLPYSLRFYETKVS